MEKDLPDVNLGGDMDLSGGGNGGGDDDDDHDNSRNPLKNPLINRAKE